jgi:hypothetical protein
MKRTHKTTGWTREAIGYGNYRIEPTDGSGTRTVAFMSAGSWANLPNDNRANINSDRVVLMTGEPLPEWAVEWLTKANAKQCDHGRDALQAAIADADWNEARQMGDF